MNARIFLKYRYTLNAIETRISESEANNPKTKPTPNSKSFGYKFNTVRLAPMFVMPRNTEIH